MPCIYIYMVENETKDYSDYLWVMGLWMIPIFFSILCSKFPQ